MKAFPHVGKLKKIKIGHDRMELSKYINPVTGHFQYKEMLLIQKQYCNTSLTSIPLLDCKSGLLKGVASLEGYNIR